MQNRTGALTADHTLLCKGAESQFNLFRSSSPELKESLEMLLANLRLELAEHQSSRGQHMALDKVGYAHWACWPNPAIQLILPCAIQPVIQAIWATLSIVGCLPDEDDWS